MGNLNPAFGAMSTMGSLFFTVLAHQIMPYVSISLFIYDRQFYTREAASKMYSGRWVRSFDVATLRGGTMYSP